ncbi:hypothetical protein FALBO_10965 [Fusarium albosuccineum]|uniref:Uncharacterized protein n=1 Tax=Fusarium albosuccineum TaxID=1237068 RepID=A0A8H4P4J5_9HYPO|nr:hypothetical protein FALBO_10965 [Fusarium albosuccineum]
MSVLGLGDLGRTDGWDVEDTPPPMTAVGKKHEEVYEALDTPKTESEDMGWQREKTEGTRMETPAPTVTWLDENGVDVSIPCSRVLAWSAFKVPDTHIDTGLVLGVARAADRCKLAMPEEHEKKLDFNSISED